ncbi:pyridoxal-phosphate-dependent aminotransferase family protein [Helicobacter heilmannii]|uniref:Phosphoserine aminotransferase n=2 Tax=Helicobacter heilmannii TaxID=35817 RepID=A0A0K2Y677_HELHE|nr:alanine--glyoxylate aminotransferase family protein [Helicobacter heilmannii]CCM10988.1 Phosphoserine aminotransferase [Helicobacter heilmannii ASB1.4]CRI33627.1 Phosphoserine aminotransferase [Helicobacter heilmannii]
MKPTQTLLFTPGPTPIHPAISNTLSQPIPHHRTPEFEAIFGSVRQKLKEMVGLAEVLTLVSSGTGAMEAAISQFVRPSPEPALLVLNNGKFGERFGKIARAHGLSVVELKSAWDTPISPAQVLEALQKNPSIQAIALQVCDSSGGLRLDFEGISKAAKEHNPKIITVIDAITALGVEPLDTTHVDVLIGGSQKAFMLPVGLGFLALSDFALSRLEDRGYYFNLKLELKNQQKNTTAFTAGISHILGLQTYFALVQELGGLEVLYTATKRRAESSNKALEALGLKIYPKAPALCMSVIYHEQAKDIRKHLNTKYGVLVAGGQDGLKDYLLRINHMGIIEVYQSAWVLSALEQSLVDLGLKAQFEGVAIKAFMQHHYKEI